MEKRQIFTDRCEELEHYCEMLDEAAKAVTHPLIGEIAFLESRLTELKKYPFISVNPQNPSMQRHTAASKQYKEYLQQYNNCIKLLLSALGKIESTDDSPLRQYLKQLQNNE